ncbi:MAG: hypothetical protein D6834_01100 [Aquificota bacterium]|nr:MAG: hypothetical protein D6834_01100 [Aquificota bacterium]
MYKTVLILILGLFFISNAATKKEIKLLNVMQGMEKDAVFILKGFLRNNNKWIIKGAEDIEKHPDIIEKIYSYARPERRTEAFKKYIVEFDNFVRKEAKAIKKYIKEGNKGKASQHFAKMLDRCNGCHAVFRGW